MRLTKFREVETIAETAEYELRPDKGEGALVLRIQALPADYDDTSAEELPTPKPERLGIERDGKTGRAVVGPDDEPVIRYKDQDPDYLRAVAKWNKRMGVKMVLDGIEDGLIDFEAVKAPGEAEAYYDAILGEFKEFGFNMGDLLGCVKAIQKLSRIGDDEIKAAEKGFTVAED